MIARDVKRKKLVERYAAKRAALMAAFNAARDPMQRLEIHRKIQALLVTAHRTADATVAGPQASHVVSIAISAFAAINFANVPIKGNSLEWSSPAGNHQLGLNNQASNNTVSTTNFKASKTTKTLRGCIQSPFFLWLFKRRIRNQIQGSPHQPLPSARM